MQKAQFSYGGFGGPGNMFQSMAPYRTAYWSG